MEVIFLPELLVCLVGGLLCIHVVRRTKQRTGDWFRHGGDGDPVVMEDGPVFGPAYHYLEAAMLAAPLDSIKGGADGRQMLHEVADSRMSRAPHDSVKGLGREASPHHLGNGSFVVQAGYGGRYWERQTGVQGVRQFVQGSGPQEEPLGGSHGREVFTGLDGRLECLVSGRQ